MIVLCPFFTIKSLIFLLIFSSKYSNFGFDLGIFIKSLVLYAFKFFLNLLNVDLSLNLQYDNNGSVNSL